MNKKTIILLILAVVGLFYWFELRPNSIRQMCHKEAQEDSVRFVTFEDEPDTKKREILQDKAEQRYYKSCLRENGLEDE